MAELKTNWIVGTVSERLAMVASGKADLDCANTSATLSRMKDVDFSALIFLESGGLLVKDGGEGIDREAKLAISVLAEVRALVPRLRHSECVDDEHRRLLLAQAVLHIL